MNIFKQRIALDTTPRVNFQMRNLNIIFFFFKRTIRSVPVLYYIQLNLVIVLFKKCGSVFRQWNCDSTFVLLKREHCNLSWINVVVVFFLSLS